jgi:hypothetical protein
MVWLGLVQRMQESAAGLRYCTYKLGSSQGDVSDLVKVLCMSCGVGWSLDWYLT